MKKTYQRILTLFLVFSCVFSITSFAAVERPNIAHTPPADTKLLSPDQTYSRDTTLALLRGNLLSTCVLNISNAGGGEIGILADTICNTDVDALYVTIYLDRYNDSTGKWVNKEVYDFEFTPNDTSDGRLNEMLISFRETNQTPGYYYRLWAYHEAEKNGTWETMRTATDGILITSTP